MNTAVFVVRGSPLQFLSVMEAAVYYGLPVDARRLIVVLPSGRTEGSRHGHEQLLALVDRFGWKIHATIDDQTGIEWAPDRLFIGNLNDPVLRRVARGQKAPVTAMDDGNSSLLIADRRSKPLWRLTDRRRASLRMGRAQVPSPGLLSDMLKPASRDFAQVEFFSAFVRSAGRRDTVVRNQFGFLRSQVHGRLEQRPILVGSSYASDGLISADEYLEILVTGLGKQADRALFFPHRRESPSLVEELRERTGVEVLQPRWPLEVELIDRRILPTPLLSLSSSAHLTVPLIIKGTEAHSILPSHLRTASKRTNRAVNKMTELMRMCDCEGET